MTGNLMYRKFYELLIIGNPRATILHIPNRNNGIMECWNREIIAFYAVICQGRKLGAKPVVPIVSAVGVYLPEGRHPIIPFFQHSIIPISCERSEPKFLYFSHNLDEVRTIISKQSKKDTLLIKTAHQAK